MQLTLSDCKNAIVNQCNYDSLILEIFLPKNFQFRSTMRRNKEPQKKEPPPPAKNGAGKQESTNWLKETALHGFKYFTFATSVLAKVIWVSQNQSVYVRTGLVNSYISISRAFFSFVSTSMQSQSSLIASKNGQENPQRQELKLLLLRIRIQISQLCQFAMKCHTPTIVGNYRP